jgi:hypothetical protein
MTGFESSVAAFLASGRRVVTVLGTAAAGDAATESEFLALCNVADPGITGATPGVVAGAVTGAVTLETADNVRMARARSALRGESWPFLDISLRIGGRFAPLLKSESAP